MSEYQLPKNPLFIDHATSRLEIYDHEDVLDPNRVDTLRLLDIQLGDTHVEWQQQNHFANGKAIGLKFDLVISVGSVWNAPEEEQIQTRLEKAEDFLTSLDGCHVDRTESNKDATFMEIEPEDAMQLIAEVNFAHRALHISNYLATDSHTEQGACLTQFETLDAEDQLLQFGRIMMRVIETVVAESGVEARIYAVNQAGEARFATVQQKSGELVVSQQIKAPDQEKPRLADILLSAQVKRQVELIIASRKPNSAQSKWQVPPVKGALFHGDPGNGKTTLSYAIANELGIDPKIVRGTDVYNMWVGNSAAKIQKVFEEVTEDNKPAVLLFDEFDKVLACGNDEVRSSVLAIMQNSMDHLSPHVLVLATTNNKDGIDPALIRPGRFQSIYIENPGSDQIADMFHRHFINDFERPGTFRMYGDIDVPTLVEACTGLTGAHVNAVLDEARRKKAHLEDTGAKDVGPISTDDILAEILHLRTS